MNFSFYPEAQIELDDSVKYYEGCQRGLGLNFAEEVFLAIKRIVQYPEAWSPLSKNTRRCLTNRFPYGIIYQVTDQEIIIIAVMHLSKKPDYWKNRKRLV